MLTLAALGVIWGYHPDALDLPIGGERVLPPGVRGKGSQGAAAGGLLAEGVQVEVGAVPNHGVLRPCIGRQLAHWSVPNSGDASTDRCPPITPDPLCLP